MKKEIFRRTKFMLLKIKKQGENMFKELSVVFSSDNNYCQHLGVALYSLLVNNVGFQKINIYIIENEINSENKNKLKKICEEFSNNEIIFINFQNWKKKLKLKLAWKISISSYARLFVGSMLPKKVKRVLYLDCDLIICKSLEELWNEELSEKIIGAVEDTMHKEWKKAVGIEENEPYFNAGMLLIDLEKWRKQKFELKCLNFLEMHNGCVIHHDQGVLNGVIHGNWKRVQLKYNIMTIHYFFDRKKCGKFFKDKAQFYSKNEIEEAKENPQIIHFTPSFTTRPWVTGCMHPLKKKYWEYLAETPWNGAKEEKDKRKWYVKIIEWYYRNLYF